MANEAQIGPMRQRGSQCGRGPERHTGRQLSCDLCKPMKEASFDLFILASFSLFVWVSIWMVVMRPFDEAINEVISEASNNFTERGSEKEAL